MQSKKTIEKLEDSLSHFLISEMCKADPTRRGSPEMYRYKGLSLTIDPEQKTDEKTLKVRIGVLEAEYKIDTCEKNSGCLSPEEERLFSMWLGRSENNFAIKTVFGKKKIKYKLPIIPFDLENFYS